MEEDLESLKNKLEKMYACKEAYRKLAQQGVEEIKYCNKIWSTEYLIRRSKEMILELNSIENVGA